MAGHQGLHRVVKTVKGKKGSTHRAYWVKNEQGPAAHPGIMHRAAVGAAKVGAVALAGAATLAAVAYGAHKLSSHIAAHGGSAPGRGVVAHHMNPVRERAQDFVNVQKAALSAARTRSTDASNIRKAATHAARNAAPSHPGIVRRSAKRSK